MSESGRESGTARKEGGMEGNRGKLPQNPLSRLDTLGCAPAVVVAKGHPHEVLMSGSLNQPPLASTTLRHRRQPPSSTKAPRRGKNSRYWVESESVSCSFPRRIAVPFLLLLLHPRRPRCSFLSARFTPSTLLRRLPRGIIRGSVHKNRGNKDPFSRPKREGQRGEGRGGRGRG